MTTSNKITLFRLVLAHLEPYRARLQSNCQLKIEFISWCNGNDRIEVTVIRWRDGHINKHDWATYNLDEPSDRNINSFIDDAVEKIKPFIH